MGGCCTSQPDIIQRQIDEIVVKPPTPSAEVKDKAANVTDNGLQSEPSAIVKDNAPQSEPSANMIESAPQSDPKSPPSADEEQSEDQNPDNILKKHVQLSFDNIELNQLHVNQQRGWWQKLFKALQGSMGEILKNEFYVKRDLSDIDVKAKQQCIEMMAPINEINWQCIIRQNRRKDDKGNLLEDRAYPDMESIQLGQVMNQIHDHPSTEKRLELPSTRTVANLYSHIMVNQKGEHKAIKKADTNVRANRIRPETFHKAAGIELNLTLTKEKEAFAKQQGAYGCEWAIIVKGDKRVPGIDIYCHSFPTFEEMMNGILNWNIQQAKRTLKNASPQAKAKIFRGRNKKFELLRNAIKIQNTKVPLQGVYNHMEGMDPELGLRNPYSKITCFILYLYSLEFGSPPLYAEMNRVARDMDMSELENLGPILRALTVITRECEKFRSQDDMIKTGVQYKQEIGGIDNNWCGCFLLFRGAHMKEDWLSPWVNNVGKPVMIPGNSSCSNSLEVALGFSGACSPKPDYIPVLFVFCLRNFRSPCGIRMNNEAYTSFPIEGETLFMEGIAVRVMGVDKDVVIANDHKGFTEFNGKTITILYLYND